MKKYYISCQHYWEDGRYIVEISEGRNYANPDMLVAKFSYLGEDKEFLNPIDAVEAAIQIKNKWQKISTETIHLGYGSTGGFTMPFDSSSDKEAIEWGELEYEKLTKCEECGKILGDTWWEDDFGDLKFCCELCCNNFENPNNV